MYPSLIVYVVLLVAGVVKWKKNNDKRYFWYLFPVSGLLIVAVSKYLLDKYLPLTGDQHAIEFFIFAALNVIGVITLLLITLKKSFK